MSIQICWSEGYQQSNCRQWLWREWGHTAYGAPSRVGTFFIRLQLSHWQRYQQSSYLLTRQSQILQEQLDWTNNISLKYWHKFSHWKWCSVKRHRFNYGTAFMWEERTCNTAISWNLFITNCHQSSAQKSLLPVKQNDNSNLNWSTYIKMKRKSFKIFKCTHKKLMAWNK